MLYHTRDMYFYHSTHEVNTAFGKDILFLTERKKISGKKKKKDTLKWALSNKTPTIKIKSSSLFFMTFIMFTGGCSPTELINLAIIQKKKKGP